MPSKLNAFVQSYYVLLINDTHDFHKDGTLFSHDFFLLAFNSRKMDSRPHSIAELGLWRCSEAGVVVD